MVGEIGARLHVTYDLDTTDAEAERRYFAYLEHMAPAVHKAENELTKKLLATGLEPEGFSVPLRNMGAEVALFRDANLPLFTEQRKIATQYDKIVGAQTVEWEGQERPLPQMLPVFEDPDRATRERRHEALVLLETYFGEADGAERPTGWGRMPRPERAGHEIS